jgi:hypothetical protein
MNRPMHRYVAFTALLLSILTIVPAPSGLSQMPAAEQVQEQQPGLRKPIPRSWKIAGAAAAVVLFAVALALAVRAWHAGNLFDREYRFPPVASAALRLGANKSGGCMATIKFRDRGDPASEAN